MARARRRGSVKLLGVTRRSRPALLVSTALCATVAIVVSLPAAGQPAPNALPTGGVVFGGSASISQSTNQTTINQASQRAAINWQSFNIGSQAQVQFNQPNAAAVALNRVTTPNPSQIAGKLDANGQVIIENQSGVVFYKGSQVNTAGLMVSAASSGDAATRTFLNGGKLVTDLAANPNAAVINQGRITVKQAGLAALVAPQVRNDGVIVARLGHVVLASGAETTLDLYGDGLMSIDVTGLVTKLPSGATALVTNTGIIVADGGTVQLTAREADSVVQTLVDAGGKIRANTIEGHTGTIRLAGVGGNITIEGQLQANGAAPGTAGGNIVVNPSGNVNIASTARISASGQAGGGVIAVGTTLKRAKGGPGTAATHSSAGVYIAPGAQIAANATRSGNGGRVTVLSTGTTVINGTISATGGPLGGNGGFVETSGDTLGMTTGSVDVGAPKGAAGTWLLDPTDLYIVSSGGDQDGNFGSGNGTITTGGSNTTNNQLSASVLNHASGNVLLQAGQTIEVESSFSIPAGSLTMEAGQLIQIDANQVAAASGDIILGVGGAGPGTTPAPVANASIAVNGSLISGAGNVSLLTGTLGAIALGNNGLVQAASSKTVTIQGDTLSVGTSGSIIAPSGTIEIAPATVGDAINFASNNAGTLQIPTSALANMSASVLRLGAVTLGGTQTTTAGSINFDTNVNLGGVASTLDVHATGDVARTNSTIVLSVATLTGSIGGNLLLAGGVTTGNVIGTVGSFSVGAGDEFQLLTTGGVTIAGPVDAGADFYEADVSGANINITGSVGATGSAILSGVGGTINVSGIINTPNLTIGTFGTFVMTGATPTIGQTGGTLALGAVGGAFESSTGTILAGTIVSEAGFGIGIGTVSLQGSGNTVSNLGSLSASGDFLLSTKSALTVGDTLAATGSIYLQSMNAGGITVSSTGSVLAGSGKLASFQTDAFANNGTVIAPGGIVELAPNTSGAAIALGTGGYLTSVSGISASAVRIGAVTVPVVGTLSTTAGTISIASNFGSSAVALDLHSLGSITQGSGAVLTASTLTGNAVGTVDLTEAPNQIAVIGAFNVSGSPGGFGLVEATNQNLTVAGGLSAPGAINLTTSGTGTIGVTGAMSAQTVALNSGAAIIEGAGGTITGTSSVLMSGSAISIGGAINDGGSSPGTGTLTLAATGPGSAGTIGETGLIVFGTLTGAATSSVSLTGSNAVATLGSFAVTGAGGSFSLTDAAGQNLSVTGPVSATQNVTLINSGNAFIHTTGSINAGASLAIASGSGGIALTGAGAILTAPAISLNGGAGGIAMTGGALLGETGAVISLAASANGVTEDAASQIIAATLQSAGSITGGVALNGTNAIATLGSFTADNLTLLNGSSLGVGGPVSVNNVTLTTESGGIAVTGSLTATDVADLISAGTIDAGSGVLAVGTLMGAASLGANFSGSNTIATLGSFALAGGNFDLTNTGSLSITGALSAANATLTAGGIALNSGSIIAPNGVVSLTSTTGAIALTGTALLNGKTVAFASETGITEATTAKIVASTLSATAAGGDVQLGSTLNSIAAVTGVGAPGSNITIVSDPNMLLTGTFTGASMEYEVTAPADVLQIGSAGVGATLNATGTISLLADTITESTSSTLVAGGAVEIAPSTGIGISLNGIQGSGGLVVDATLLGEINTPLLRIGQAAGTTTATGISLANSMNTGTIALELDTIGAVIEPGSVALTTPTLTGTAGGAVSLLGANNAIGTLGAFSAGGNFELLDNAATFDIAGLLQAGGNIFIKQGPAQELALLSTGSVVSTTNGTIGLIADQFAFASGASISAGTGTVEIAPVTAGSTLSLATGGLAIGSAMVSASRLRVGGYHDQINGGFSITAGSIDIASGVTLGVPTLELDATGQVTESTGTLSVAALTGTVTSGNVDLGNAANAIGTLGNFLVSNGTLTLADSGATTLTVNGTASASDILINAGSISLPSGGMLSANGVVDLSTTSGGISETGGVIASTVLQSSSGAAGTVNLGGANNVGTLGQFVLASGTFSLNDTGSSTGLVVPGTLTASSVALTIGSGTLGVGGVIGASSVGGVVSLTGTSGASTIALNGSAIVSGPTVVLNAGTIGLNGSSSLGSSTGLVDLSASSGGVNEASTATIAAATLQSSGNITGGAILAGAQNDISALGRFIVATGNLDLVDPLAANLAVNGPVSAAGVTITGPGTINVGSGINATAGTLLLSGGSIVLATNGVLTDSSGVVDLSTTSGGITETGGSIVAAVLQSTSNAAGAVTLGDANNVGTLAGFVVNNGSLLLVDGSGNLNVTGSVSAAGVMLVAGTIATSNSIVSTMNAGLTATSAGITIGSLLSAGGALDLSAPGGAVTELNGGTIVAATLLSGQGVGNGATLLNTTNRIGALGQFAVSNGPFLLVDGQSLSIAGSVSGVDTVFIKDSAAGGITLAPGGALTASGSPLIELVADQLTTSAGFGTIGAAGGTVAIAPFTSGTPVSLGGSANNAGTLLIAGNLLADLNTGAGTLQIGGYSDLANGGNGTVTAGNISVDGAVALNTHANTLKLVSNSGSVVETGSNGIQVGTLIGTVAAGATLTSSNTIATLAGFLASNGSMTLNDSGESGGTLAVTGLVSANNVGLTGAGGETIVTGVTATTGNIQVSGGSIALGANGVLQATAGSVDLDSSTGGIAESGGGSIVALTLLSSTGAHGNVDLASANAVGTLGSFFVTGGTFHLSNSGSLSGMTVAGPVIASSVTLDGLSGMLAVDNAIAATGAGGLVSITDTGTGGNIALNSGAVVTGPIIDLKTGAIALNGNAILGDAAALLDLTTTSGGVTEATTASILAATLQSSGGIANSVSLGGAGNSIAAIASLAVGSSGTFTLADNGNLDVGTLTASSIGIADSNGTLTVSNSLIATSGVSLAATTILIPGEVSDGGSGTTVLLANGGSIIETGRLIAGTLSGSAAAIAMFGTSTAANQIANVSSFSANGFVLNDGVALNVGSISGGAFASIDVAGSLTVNALVSANTIGLTATSINIPALVDAGASGPVSLIATSGSINETGTIIAGTLSGSAITAANLAGAVNGTAFANQIGTLGNFSAASFVLDTGSALVVAGSVNGGGNVAIDASQALTVTGSVVGTNLVSLTGSAIAITGAALVSDGGSGTTDLVATGGTIFENATMVAGTLNGSATGSADFSGNNTIASVGSFGANGFVLNDGATALNIGTVMGGTLASIDVAGVLSIASLVSATAVDLTASTILIPGTVNATTAGSVELIASSGSINETGLIVAGTLSGSASGVADLVGATTIANQILSVSSFSSNGFVLNDGTNLAIGTVIGSSAATIFDAGTLTVGTLVSASNISLTAGAIGIPGEVTAGTTGTASLVATSGGISETGTLIAGTLSGSAAMAADFLGASASANQILNVGSFGSSGFVLNDGTALTVGVINSGTLASIDVAGMLTVNTLVGNGAVDLTAASIVVPGMVTAGAGGTADLIANPGSIAVTGTLIAGTVAGSSTGATDIANAMIGTLGSFSAAAFVLNDGTSLTVIAPVIANTSSVAIAVTGTLTNNSTVMAATAAELSATGNFNNAGSVIAANGDASLISGTASLLNSGLVLASNNATLTAATNLTNRGSIFANGGSAVIAANNGTLANNGGLIRAGTSTTLTAATSLSNSGSVIAEGGNALLTATTGSLTNGGLVETSANATLTAATSLGNTGSIFANGGSAVVAANNGTLANTGGLIQASTSTTLTASASLANTGSVIAKAGNALLTASGGTLSNGGLIQASGNTTLVAMAGLTNTGSVGAQAGNALLSTATGTLSNGGSISAGGTITATASSGPIVQSAGASMVAATEVALNANGAGGMALNGVVDGTGSVVLHSGGTIFQNGSLISPVLTGSAASAVNLLGATVAANQVGALTSFTAGGFTLRDGEALTVTGPVNGGPAVTIVDAAALTVGGVVQSTNAVSLTGSSVTINGSGVVSDGGAGSTSLTATGGAITETGALIAGTLSGNATGAATLTGANQIAALANFSAASLTLQDGADLTATGLVTATSGAIAIATEGALTNNSVVQAATSVTLNAGSNVNNTGSIIAQGGDASITASGGTLSNGGLVEASTNATLSAAINVTNTGSVVAQTGSALLSASGGLLSNGGLVEAGGNATLNAATSVTNTGLVIAQAGNASLNASGGALLNDGLILASANTVLTAASSVTNRGSIIAQAGNASLTASNGALFNSGLMSAGGTLSLTASAGSIIQSGQGASMSAGARIITNAAGSISLDGLVKDDIGVVLTAGGNIFQDGVLIADLLTGSAGGTVNLSGASPTSNQVAELGNFTAGGGSFILQDGVGLLINGVISAATIQIMDPGQVTVSGGGFVTGGATPPGTTLAMSQFPTAATTPGAYLTVGSLIETGSFTVSNLPGTPVSILAITLPGGGSVQFGGSGLVAPTTWLIMNVGNGSASGTFNVDALNFSYTQPAGNASFDNVTIDNLTGNAAAGAAFIEPLPSSNFRINGCPIHAVNCTILTTQTLPQASPVSNILFGASGNSQNPEDLVLPVVSDERYELLPCLSPDVQGGSCGEIKRPAR